MENPIRKEAIKVQTVLDLAEAADFIQNTWQSNWGHCKEYSI